MTASEEDRAVAGAATLAQRGVERERMAGDGDLGLEGEIGLIDVARLDIGTCASARR